LNIDADQAAENVIQNRICHNQQFEKFTNKLNVTKQLFLELELAVKAVVFPLVLLLDNNLGCI